MKPNHMQDAWRFVDRRASDECWPWTGYIGTNGYGKFRVSGEYILAHRAIYTAEHGSIPARSIICHSCNCKRCCNPQHLIASNASMNQVHYSLTDGSPALSNTDIKGVSYNKKRNQYQATACTNGKSFFLYRGPSIFGAWAARLEWELNARLVLNRQGLRV